MAPLFDLAGYATTESDRPASRTRKPAPITEPPSPRPVPVAYWIRGVFRFPSGEERTRTVEGHTMSDRRDADVEKFAAYLSASGWLFPEGRGIMVNLLGVGAQDGGAILLTQS